MVTSCSMQGCTRFPRPWAEFGLALQVPVSAKETPVTSVNYFEVSRPLLHSTFPVLLTDEERLSDSSKALPKAGSQADVTTTNAIKKSLGVS